jgi:hypothetical protein
MKRREFISLLGGATSALYSIAARAQQQAKMSRLGYLAPARLPNLIDALQAGLRDFGYVEGQNGSMLLDHARVAVSQIPRHDEQWRAVHHRQAAVADCPIERAARSSALLLRKRAIVNSR